MFEFSIASYFYLLLFLITIFLKYLMFHVLQENASYYFIVIYLSWSQLSLVLTFSRTPDYGGNINWAIISFSREIPRRFIMKDFLKQSAKLTQHTTYNLHFRTKLSLALWVLWTTLAKVEMSEILRCRWASRNMLGVTVTLLPSHWSLVGSQG